MAGPWDKYRSAPADGGAAIITSPVTPQDRLDLQYKQGQIAAQGRDAATAPYDARRAAAEAAKAEAEANIAQAKAGAEGGDKERQKQIRTDLQADNVLAAIERAKRQILAGRSAGNLAGTGAFQSIPILGQNSADLAATLSGIQGSVINDTIMQLKELSATGASGYGSLTEGEAQRLAAAVAAIQQTQSPAELERSLNTVRRHYLNAKALLNNEDPRLPEVQKRYGIEQEDKSPPPAVGGITRTQQQIIDPGNGGGISVAKGATQTRDNPAMKGVNATIERMVKQGLPADSIKSYVASVGLDPSKVSGIDEAVAFRQRNPTYKGSYQVNVDDQEVPLSAFQETMNAVGENSAPGAYFINAMDALSAGNLDSLTSNPATTRALMQGVKTENPLSAFAGQVGGGVLGTLGVGRALGAAGGAARLPSGIMGALRAPVAADATYGALYGAGNADEGSRLTGALTGGLLGATGGYVGNRVTGGIGAAATGVTDPAVQYLASRGVRMTPGQMVGGIAKRSEDRLSGFSGLGDRVTALRRRGVEDFNRAAFEEGLAPIGARPNGIGEAGLEAARGAVSGAYDNTLNGVNLQADQPFMGAVSAAQARGRRIPGPLAAEFDGTLQSRVGPYIDPNTGAISGRNYQEIQRGLRQDRAAFSGQPRFDLYSNEVGAVEDAMRDLVQRQSPGTVEGLDAANSAYGNLQSLTDAVLAGKNTGGVFTPAQLGTASVSGARRFGGKARAASTDRPFFDLQRSGQDVLPSKIPDSGTAGRARDGNIVSRMMGAATDAARAPLYIDEVQPLIRSLLMERPDQAVVLGRWLRENPRRVGIFGSPLALTYEAGQ